MVVPAFEAKSHVHELPDSQHSLLNALEAKVLQSPMSQQSRVSNYFTHHTFPRVTVPLIWAGMSCAWNHCFITSHAVQMEVFSARISSSV